MLPFLLLGKIIIAQPIFNNTYQGIIGKTFSGKSFGLPHGIPISLGPNQTWDFALIDSAYTDTIRFKVISPTASSNGSTFPMATKTIVQSNALGQVEFFYKESSTDVQNMGYQPVGSTENEKYTDNRLFFQDMVFQDAILDQSEGTRNFFGVTKYVRYLDTLYYSGFGTLITPEGTYPNVPLIQRNTGVSIADAAAGPFELLELYKSWEWYLPEFGTPYMRYGEEIYDYSIPEFATVNYLGHVGFIEPLSVKQPGRSFKTLTLKPNPAAKLTRIELEEIRNGQTTEIKWLDMQGRIVATSINRGKSVALPNLNSGIYTLLVKTETDLFRSRIVIE